MASSVLPVDNHQVFQMFLPRQAGVVDGAKVLGKLSVPGRPTSLDDQCWKWPVA